MAIINWSNSFALTLLTGEVVKQTFKSFQRYKPYEAVTQWRVFSKPYCKNRDEIFCKQCFEVKHFKQC